MADRPLASSGRNGMARPEAIVVLHEFCIRAKGADCERCVAACPVDAIAAEPGQRPSINADSCTRCGICLGICDAFSSTRITMEDLHARMRRVALQEGETVLTCREGRAPGFEPAAQVVMLPCLACLSPEFLTRTLSEGAPVKVAVDLSRCDGCTRAGDMGEALYAHAIETAETWSGRTVGFSDEVPEKGSLLQDATSPADVDRRDAFTSLIDEIGDIASGKRRLRNSKVLQEFYERRERSRAETRLNMESGTEFNDFVPEGRTKRTLWPKRRMVLEAIGHDPGIAARVPITISETDLERCTTELSCASICPTGARRPDPNDGTLAYDMRYCIGCGLCVDACGQHAISLRDATADLLLAEESHG